MAARTPLFVCDVCTKEFSYASTLARHKKEKHSEDKSFHECGTCKKVFPRRDTLARHAVSCVAAGVKITSHQCDLCLKHFTTKYNGSRHVAKCNGERPAAAQVLYSCTKWSKVFGRKDNLSRHAA